MQAWEQLEQAERILVYGAKLNALEAVLRLSQSHVQKLQGCLVQSLAGNVDRLAGYPVMALSDYLASHDVHHTAVVLALRSSFYIDVGRQLLQQGFGAVVTWDEMQWDDACNKAWLNRLLVASKIELVGEVASLPMDAELLRIIRPEAEITPVDWQEASSDALVLLDYDPAFDSHFIAMVARLWEHGCRNIMEFEYLPRYFAGKQGGELRLPTLQWQRAVWQHRARMVLSGVSWQENEDGR